MAKFRFGKLTPQELVFAQIRLKLEDYTGRKISDSELMAEVQILKKTVETRHRLRLIKQ